MSKPYLPPWAEAGCKVVEEWEEHLITAGKPYTRKMIKYLNKKGKEQVMAKQIIWEE
jgi:hypothetical protein